MKKEILLDIVSQAYDHGYTVVSTVCDMGPSNQKLLSSLNIGTMPGQNRYFAHPNNKESKIFVRYDDPHLIKLIRNHFLDTGFILNGAQITTKSVAALAKLQLNSDLKIVPGLIGKMLNVVGSERQKVKWATKLLSKRVANAIRFLGRKGFLIDDLFWEETADFVELVNDWFDVCNSHTKYGSHPGIHGYGVSLEYQSKILDRMSYVMENIRSISKNSRMLPFQKGIILNNMALKELLVYLKQKYVGSEIDYILTRKLNQDVLEQAFATFRSMGRTHENPSALDIKYRIRNYLLGRHAATILAANTTNAEMQGDGEIILTHDFVASHNPDEEIELDQILAEEDEDGNELAQHCVFNLDLEEMCDEEVMNLILFNNIFFLSVVLLHIQNILSIFAVFFLNIIC